MTGIAAFMFALGYISVGQGVAEVLEPKAGFWRRTIIELSWPRLLGVMLARRAVADEMQQEPPR